MLQGLQESSFYKWQIFIFSDYDVIEYFYPHDLASSLSLRTAFQLTQLLLSLLVDIVYYATGSIQLNNQLSRNEVQWILK